MKLYNAIVNLDRRIIFVFVALSVIIPILLKLTFPEFPTETTTRVYEQIDKLPAGSKILISADYDPGSEPEITPMMTALLRQLMLKNHKIYFIALWPMGHQLTEKAVEQVIVGEFPEKKYGIDYMNLGFKAGGQGVITVIISNIEKLFPADAKNTPLNQIPMMQGVKSLKNMDMIISLSAGWPGTKEWIQFASDPLQIPIVSGSVAVQAPQLYPYYPRQLQGILGGIKGAAEYEAILMKNYEQYSNPKMHSAIVRWGPQTIAHIVILIFIILGNVIYFVDKKRRLA